MAYNQGRTINTSVEGASRHTEGLIEATRSGSGSGSGSGSASSTSGSAGLGAAFNAGFDDSRYAPGSAGGEFGEFDDVAPIAPLSSGSQSVQVSGSSFESYTVKKGDNLWSIAKRYNISLSELYAANGLNKNSVLKIGQQLQIPVEGGSATVNTVSADTYQPSSFSQGSTNYTVKRGDSLSKIAQQHNTTVRGIKAANSMTSDLIRVGDQLVVPVSGGSSGASASSTTSSRTPSVTYAAPSVNVSGSRTHTVKSGEYPATIARKYGMTAGELLALNGITDPRKLQVGQVLKVSGSGSAANVDSRTETVVAPTAASASASASFVTPSTSVTRTPAPAASAGPVQITVIEADPLVEGEVTEIQSDEMFEGAVEIPVIRLEE
ncbi:LysM peptidoglycan-binding domain-containing protein [Coraliomargarita sp. W4R53]